MSKKENVLIVEGRGGGKSAGKSSGPNEAPNSLQSKARARFVDLLCEGPIKGFVTDDVPEKSIVFNKVAVANPDNSRNFKGFKFAMLPGTSDQPALPGFDDISAEYDVGRQVRADTPVIYTTTGDNLDAIVATVNIPALTQQDKKTGDLNGYSVTIAIDVKNISNPANQWVTAVSGDTISGKNTSPYERSYRVALSGTGPWQVRMRRISADVDNDVTISNKTYFSHISEIIEHKIAYADSAVIGIDIDAEQFGTSIPDRSYDLFLLEHEYPSNYNPVTRQYTGFWDGTFNFGWCDNPAWVFRTLAKHERLGADVDPAFLDKWNLYKLAKYCDVMVPDGFGGTEPRFSFNGLLRTQEDAYKVLQSVASMMRSIVFYSAGAVIVRQDAPGEAEHNIYTPANVVGDFDYGGTALKVRHNAAIVQWINPTIGYDTDYVSYEDREAIIKYGYNPLSLKAVGTTSEGQAYRQGKWAILTEQYQTETVTFVAGNDSANTLPGDIIEIADPHKATADFGGRVLPASVVNVYAQAITGWTGTGCSFGPERDAGPIGPENLAKLSASGSSGAHYLISGTQSAAGQHTVSIYVRAGAARKISFGVTGTGTKAYALFDLKTRKALGKVILGGTTIDDFSIFDEGAGLFRLVVTYTASVAMSAVLGFHDPSVGKAADVTASSFNGAGLDVFVGSPQLEAGATATPYRPALSNASTQVVLDRDIDFTGATSPELHVTLLDGAYDDVEGIASNADRPARRKITYFSSAISSYDPLTQIATLSAAIPSGGNDGLTPLIWIFSKEQLAPTKWKVIEVTETDKREYQITALNYSDDKFEQMDDLFYIREDNRKFSDLPLTSFCYPPSDLRVLYTTTYVGGVAQITIDLDWKESPDQFVAGYHVRYKRDDDNWVTMPITAATHMTLSGLAPGAYLFEVFAQSRLGTFSAAITKSFDVNEQTASGKSFVYGIVTDRGDTTFTDKDIKIFWSATSISQRPDAVGVVATVYKAVDTNGGAASTGDVVVNLDDLDAPTFAVSGTWAVGDSVVIYVGQSSFTVTAADTTSTAFAEAIKSALDADPRFAASRAGGVVTLTFSDGSTNASQLYAHNDPLFKAYRVSVVNPLTSAVLRIDDVVTPEYRYSYSNNVLDNGGTPLRSVNFVIRVVDIQDNVSAPTVVNVNNPPPVAPTVTVTAKAGEFTLKFTPPNDPDFVGIKVWASASPGFTPGAGNLAYDGPGNPTIQAEASSTVYYRYAFYDAFGMTGVAISVEASIFIPGLTYEDLDTTPPAVPTFGGSPFTSEFVTDPSSGQPVGSLTFSWNKVLDEDLAGYEIEFKEGSGVFIGGWSANRDNTSITISGIKSATSYSARIRAFDRVGNISAWSATAGPYTTLKDDVAPGAPSSLSALDGFKTIYLSWINPSDSDVAYVEIYENSTSDSLTAALVGTVNASPSSVGGYTRSGLPNNVTRYYWVKAVDTSGNVSTFSSAASASTAPIDGLDIGNNAITAAQIADAAITNVQIASGTITADEIAYQTITASQLAGNSVTTDKIVDGALTAPKFPQNVRPVENVISLPTTGNFEGRIAFYNGQLYRYTSGQWSKSVPAADMTGQITSTQISDDAITTPKIAAGAVTAAEIAANTITGNKIAAGTIVAANIASQAITASKLAIGDTSNMAMDPELSDASLWESNATAYWQHAIPTNDIVASKYVTALFGGGGGFIRSSVTGMTPCEPGKDYFVHAAAWTVGTPGAVYAFFRTKSGTVLASTPLLGYFTTPSITRLEKIVTAPADAVSIGIWLDRTPGSPDSCYMAEPIIRRAAAGELIVDGAITANKILAGAVTADKIAANTITGNKIAAGTITTDKLVVAAGNLIANSDFATGDFTNWRPYGASDKQSVVLSTSSGVPAGAPTRYVAKYSNTGAPQSITTFAASKAYTDVGADNDGFVFVPGQEYLLTVQVACSSDFVSPTTRVSVYYYKNDGTGTSSIPNELYIYPTPTWQTFTWSFVAPEGALRAWPYFWSYEVTAGSLFWTNLRVWPKAGGNLIVDGAITANKIAAGAITTSKLLVVGNDTAINPDPNLVDPTAWDHSANGVWTFGEVDASSPTGLRLTIENPADSMFGRAVPFDINKDYRVSMFTKLLNAAYGSQITYLAVTFYDANFTPLYGGSPGSSGWGGIGTWYYFGLVGAAIPVDWTEYSIDFGPTSTAKAPTGAKYVAIGCLPMYGNADPGVKQGFAACRIVEKVSGSLIVDGAITANKIAAGSITGDRISTSTSLPGTITVGSTGVSIGTVQTKVSNALDYADTRNDNFSPDYYLAKGRGEYAEFKYLMNIEIGVGGYGQLVTTVSYPDYSGGPIRQEAVTSEGRRLNRVSTSGTTWGAWMDVAGQVNIGSTVIDPGKILISGGTTLSNWRNGGDNTKIEGGSIAANTISANKLQVGNRNIQVRDCTFSVSADGTTLSWTSGYIFYRNDNDVIVYNGIPAGSTSPASGAYAYPYWTKPALANQYDGFTTPLTVGTYHDEGLHDDQIQFAAWQQGTKTLVQNYGGTIIDGSRITTGTITATQIAANTITAAQIAAGTITATQIASGAITADKLNVSSLSAITATIGTLRTATSGERLELSDNVIKIFDSVRIKVKLGNLAL